MQSMAVSACALDTRAASLHGELAARDIARISAIAAIAAICMLVSDRLVGSTLGSQFERLFAITLLAAGVLVYQFARLWIIWRHKSDITAKFTSGRGPVVQRQFHELFLYFVSALASLVAIAFAPSATGLLEVQQSSAPIDAGITLAPPTIVILALFGFSFLPLLTAFILQARHETSARKQPLLRDDVISPLTLILFCTFAIFIGLLAWAAADGVFSMTEDFGVIVTLAVIVFFLAAILAPHFARFWNDRAEKRHAALAGVHLNALPLPINPVKLISRLDSILVRLVAPLSGATQSGPAIPHLLLTAIMVLLSALGYALTSPFGLIPIAVAMLIALSLGRRWAWLEEDRETASRLQSTHGDEIHIGLDNDLKDEALLGYASLFVLVPLALNQLQDWTHSFNEVEGAASGNAFIDWLRFFGAELAKAVPFVDWWEIYDVKVGTPFNSENATPLAKHLTFAARALVDLVIMSALLQAFGIWARSRTQHRLYDNGQLDYFDPFTEAAFFETGVQNTPAGLAPKEKFEKRVRKHADHRRSLGQPPLPYNTKRLAELINSDNEDVQAGARWMVATFGVLAGSPIAQLRQLRPRWNVFRLAQYVALGTTEALDTVRGEKLEFERVLTALTQEATKNPALFSDDDVFLLIGLVEETRHAPDFRYSQSLVYELLGLIPRNSAALALAHFILETRHYADSPTWKTRIEDYTGMLRPQFLGRANDRMLVYDALTNLGSNERADSTTRRTSLSLLEWMATEKGDGAKFGREKANECVQKVRNSLE